MKKIFLFSKLNFDKIKKVNKKTVSFLLIMSIFCNVFYFSKAQATTTWTIQKATHLASRSLIGATPQNIDKLYKAGSAKNAVDILFPDKVGPDNQTYLSELEAFKTLNSSPTDTTQNRRVYAFKYYRDPYEAKMKLFGLFEDILPVDVGTNNITFAHVNNHFSTLYDNSLGNYKTMIKKVLFDVEKPENSFAEGKYLDLLNQPNKDYPNENYARELMQLFLMLEYKPWEDAETPNSLRNYTEADVAKLALILTGFRAGDDSKVYFDNDYHNQNKSIVFLSGSLKTGDNFSFYNTASGTIDNTEIIKSIGGNNGLADNIIDYIFSKRELEIASFLSYRLLKYYVTNTPTKEQIENLSQIIISNNFEILPSVKTLLSSDLMYQDDLMSQIWYKNPIELFIGTLKLLHSNNPNVIDPLINDTSFLTNLDYVPYNPKSVFGRSGFDDNSNFFNAYFHNQFVTLTSKFAYNTGTGYYNIGDIIGNTTYVNSGTTLVETSTGNTYSGSINIGNISLTLKDKTFEIPGYSKPISASFFSNLKSIFSPSETDSGSENTQSGSENTQTGSLETSTGSENTSTGIQNETNSGTIIEDIKTQTGVENIQTGNENISGETQDEENVEVKENVKVDEKTEIKTEENTQTSFINYFIPKVLAGENVENTYLFSTGSIKLPNFYIETGLGLKINVKGNFNQTSGVFDFLSGTLSYSGSIYEIEKMSFDIKNDYTFSRDLTIDEMFVNLENNLYLGNKIPETVKQEITKYLLTDDVGIKRSFLPNNQTYRDKYIRGVIAMLLSQVEFILKSGVNAETSNNQNGNSQINDNSKKLVMIELSGGYDWMNGIIPKTDIEYYKNIRGEMAFSGENLIDLGDVYLNKNLEAFKEFYDNGELRIVNKVGAPNHSRGHDTALRQITSQKALQTDDTPGIIGELIKNENNSLNNIVLGSQKPTVYTRGKYLNIGYNSLSYQNPVGNTTTIQKTYQLNTLKNTFSTRNYPANTKLAFDNSIVLDNLSKSQNSVGYTLAQRLNFTKNLINSGVGITYFVPGGGGYDTHQDQVKSGVYNLNDRQKDLSVDITNFFKELKTSGKDVTIIVYSEFGRTLKTNGTLGTDHGEGGGYFILTTNNKLKTELPKKVIGKLSPEKEYNDWFGVGIDYRAIYSKILESLYNIDVKSYFLGDYKLEDYLNNTLPIPIGFRQEFKHSYSNQMNVDFKFSVEDTNFLKKDGSYFKFYYGTNLGSLTQYSKWTIDNYSMQNDGSFKLNINASKNTKYYYKLELVDNQYDSYVLTGSFTTPEKYESNSPNSTISLINDTYFAKYNNTQVLENTMLSGSGIILFNNTNSGSIKQNIGDIEMTFSTGTTKIDSVFNKDNIADLKWNGGFLLPKYLNVGENISNETSFSGSKLKNLNIEKLLKIGSDVVGVGMNLSQKVVISLPINKNTGKYRVLTSEDLLNWSEIPNIIKSEGKIYFATNSFSYFAVYNEEDVVIPPVIPPVVTPEVPKTTSGGGSGGGLMRDKCPLGDNSYSYYDGKCDGEVKNISNTQDNTTINDIHTKLEIPQTKNIYGNVNLEGYELIVVKNNRLSKMLNEFELRLIQDEKFTIDQKNYIIEKCNDFMTASYFLDISKNKSKNLQINFQRKKIVFQGAINIYLLMKNS